MDDISYGSGESQDLNNVVKIDHKGRRSNRKPILPWIKKRLSFRSQTRQESFSRPGLVLINQRVVVGKTLTSLMEHRDNLTMTSLEGWVTDSNGVLPGSIMHKPTQDGGDQIPWLTELFFELGALKYCPEDKMKCLYLVNLYVPQSVVGGSETADGSRNTLISEASPDDKNYPVNCKKKRSRSKRKDREQVLPLTKTDDTLVKMCSVNAEGRCDKSRCLASEFASDKNQQNQIDKLIENIFSGAFLAERKVLTTFFKNDPLPVNVNTEKFPRNLCKGPFVFSPSVELHSDSDCELYPDRKFTSDFTIVSWDSSIKDTRQSDLTHLATAAVSKSDEVCLCPGPSNVTSVSSNEHLLMSEAQSSDSDTTGVIQTEPQKNQSDPAVVSRPLSIAHSSDGTLVSETAGLNSESTSSPETLKEAASVTRSGFCIGGFSSYGDKYTNKTDLNSNSKTSSLKTSQSHLSEQTQSDAITNDSLNNECESNGLYFVETVAHPKCELKETFRRSGGEVSGDVLPVTTHSTRLQPGSNRDDDFIHGKQTSHSEVKLMDNYTEVPVVFESSQLVPESCSFTSETKLSESIEDGACCKAMSHPPCRPTAESAGLEDIHSDRHARVDDCTGSIHVSQMPHGLEGKCPELSDAFFQKTDFDSCGLTCALRQLDGLPCGKKVHPTHQTHRGHHLVDACHCLGATVHCTCDSHGSPRPMDDHLCCGGNRLHSSPNTMRTSSSCRQDAVSCEETVHSQCCINRGHHHMDRCGISCNRVLLRPLCEIRQPSHHAHCDGCDGSPVRHLILGSKNEACQYCHLCCEENAHIVLGHASPCRLAASCCDAMTHSPRRKGKAPGICCEDVVPTVLTSVGTSTVDCSITGDRDERRRTNTVCRLLCCCGSSE